MTWDVSSITQLVAAAVALFLQVWGAIHGQSYEPTHTALGVGLAASAVAHANSNGRINGK